MKLFALLFFMFLSNAWSDDQGRYLNGFDVKADIIADNYEAGNGLIYDCVERHWVCVTNTYFDECREKRSKAKLNEDESLPCAPVAYFPNKKSCFQRQLFMTTHHHGDRFCVKDEWKLKASN